MSFHKNTLITVVNEYDFYYLSPSVSVLSATASSHMFKDMYLVTLRLTLVVKVVVFVQHLIMTIFAYIKYVTTPLLSAPPTNPCVPGFFLFLATVASSGVRLCYWKDNFAYNRQGPCIMRGQLTNSIDFRPHNCCEPTCFPYSNKKLQPVGGQEWCSEPFDFKLVKGRGPDKTFFKISR